MAPFAVVTRNNEPASVPTKSAEPSEVNEASTICAAG